MQKWPEGYPDEEQNEQIRTIFKQHAAAAKVRDRIPRLSQDDPDTVEPRL